MLEFKRWKHGKVNATDVDGNVIYWWDIFKDGEQVGYLHQEHGNSYSLTINGDYGIHTKYSTRSRAFAEARRVLE